MSATLNATKLRNLRRIVQGGQLADTIPQRTGEAIEAHIQTHWSPDSPSSPGDPPAVVTGELKNSIRLIKVGKGHWRVVVLAEHGLHLEFGTSKMAARPFVSPAVEAIRPYVLAWAKEEVLGVIRSA